MHPLPPLGPVALAREVRAAGLDDRALRRAVASGSLIRLSRGAFTSTEEWDARDEESKYRLRVIATALGSRVPQTVSHHSAAALHRAPLLRVPTQVHVLCSVAAGSRTEGRVSRHATRELDVEVEVIDGTRVTTLARTVVELAALTPFADGVCVLDWALARGRSDGVRPRPSREHLAALGSRLLSPRRLARFGRALAFADERSGSAGESLSRVGLHQAGFPEPELQHRFDDSRGLVGFVDFWWPEHALVGEFDGRAKYLRDEFTRGRSAADVVIAEKLREDRIRALGPRVSRWDWETALSLRALHAQLTAAGLPSIRRRIPVA